MKEGKTRSANKLVVVDHPSIHAAHLTDGASYAGYEKLEQDLLDGLRIQVAGYFLQAAVSVLDQRHRQVIGGLFFGNERVWTLASQLGLDTKDVVKLRREGLTLLRNKLPPSVKQVLKIYDK